MIRAFVFLLAVMLPFSAQTAPIRIKDLVEFDGVRGNDLVGYGLVVGLNGTGDGMRNAPFTEEILTNLLERLGVNVTGEQFRPKNVAAVFVTSSLPSHEWEDRSMLRFPRSVMQRACWVVRLS